MSTQTTETEARPAHRRGRPLMDEAAKKRAATFRLSPQAIDLIGALGDQMGLSQASVLETAIRDLAAARGVSPAVYLRDVTTPDASDEDAARLAALDALSTTNNRAGMPELDLSGERADVYGYTEREDAQL